MVLPKLAHLLMPSASWHGSPNEPRLPRLREGAVICALQSLCPHCAAEGHQQVKPCNQASWGISGHQVTPIPVPWGD